MRSWITAALIALGIAASLALAISFGQHWLAIHTGTISVQCNNAPCANQPFYGFWSGFGSDLGEITLVTAILTPFIVAARHANCATRGCWRLTTHTIRDPDTGVAYRRCHKHHPGIPDEHSNHGILRNHMSDEHMADVDARATDARALLR
jgi:hypothetical protein